MPQSSTSKKVLPVNKPPFAERILWVLIWIILGMGMVHLSLQFLHLSLLGGENEHILQLTNRFDFDDEASVPTWFSAVLLALTATCALFVARLQTIRRKKILWTVIGSLLLLFSIDEIAGLHEYALQLLHILFFGYDASSFFTNAWWVVLPMVVLGGAFLFTEMIKLLPRRTTMLFGLGTIIYFTGAIVLEVLTTRVDSGNFISQGVMVAAEECLELLGVAVILYAIIDYLETRHSKTLQDVLAVMKPKHAKK